MRANIFEYKHYVDFMNAWVKLKGHGSKSILAKSADIHSAYLSLVLKKEAHLSLEQVVKLKSTFEFNQAELDFFILLVLKNKSGSPELEKIFNTQISEVLSNRDLLSGRITNSVTFTIEQQVIYFSSWHYSAIHTALLIPQLQSQKQIEEYFQLKSEIVSDVLEFLEKLNLIKKVNNKFITISFRMHLPHDSKFILLHHLNWKFQAIKNIQKKSAKDFHYSSVLSLSLKDSEEFKHKLLNLLEDFEKKLKTSEDEVLYSLGLDWFELKE